MDNFRIFSYGFAYFVCDISVRNVNDANTIFVLYVQYIYLFYT